VAVIRPAQLGAPGRAPTPHDANQHGAIGIFLAVFVTILIHLFVIGTVRQYRRKR